MARRGCRRYVASGRQPRSGLVYEDGGQRYLLFTLRLRLARSAEQQLPCIRSSVALPPGIGRGRPGPGTKPPSPPSGPNPLGENIIFSSPPLKPRGLLLSVMRQKVGKERSQEGCAPLANPRRNGPNLAKPSCGPTPAAFAEKTPAFECPAAPQRPAILRIATGSVPSSALTPFSAQCRLKEAGGPDAPAGISL